MKMRHLVSLSFYTCSNNLYKSKMLYEAMDLCNGGTSYSATQIVPVGHGPISRGPDSSCVILLEVNKLAGKVSRM
jgi:hypothetical protein